MRETGRRMPEKTLWAFVTGWFVVTVLQAVIR